MASHGPTAVAIKTEQRSPPTSSKARRKRKARVYRKRDAMFEAFGLFCQSVKERQEPLIIVISDDEDGQKDTSDNRKDAGKCVTEDAGDNLKDADDIRKDGSNSQKDADDCVEDASANQKDAGDFVKDEGVSQKGADYCVKDTDGNQKDTGDNQKDTGDNQKDTGDNQKDTGDNQKDAGDNQKDAGDSQKYAGESAKDMSRTPSKVGSLWSQNKVSTSHKHSLSPFLKQLSTQRTIKTKSPLPPKRVNLHNPPPILRPHEISSSSKLASLEDAKEKGRGDKDRCFPGLKRLTIRLKRCDSVRNSKIRKLNNGDSPASVGGRLGKGKVKVDNTTQLRTNAGRARKSTTACHRATARRRISGERQAVSSPTPTRTPQINFPQSPSRRAAIPSSRISCHRQAFSSPITLPHRSSARDSVDISLLENKPVDTVGTHQPVSNNRMRLVDTTLRNCLRPIKGKSSCITDISTTPDHDQFRNQVMNLERNRIFGPYWHVYVPNLKLKGSTQTFSEYHDAFVEAALFGADDALESALDFLKDFQTRRCPSQRVMTSLMGVWKSTEALDGQQGDRCPLALIQLFRNYPKVAQDCVDDDILSVFTEDKASTHHRRSVLMAALELDLYTRTLCDSSLLRRSISHTVLSWDKGRQTVRRAVELLEANIKNPASSLGKGKSREKGSTVRHFRKDCTIEISPEEPFRPNKRKTGRVHSLEKDINRNENSHGVDPLNTNAHEIVDNIFELFREIKLNTTSLGNPDKAITPRSNGSCPLTKSSPSERHDSHSEREIKSLSSPTGGLPVFSRAASDTGTPQGTHESHEWHFSTPSSKAGRGHRVLGAKDPCHSLAHQGTDQILLRLTSQRPSLKDPARQTESDRISKDKGYSGSGGFVEISGEHRTAPSDDSGRRVSVTETPVEVSGRRVNATETPVEISGRRVNATETPVEVSGRRVNATETPVEISGRRVNATETPVEVSGRGVNSTETPVEVSGGRVSTTETPVEVNGRRVSATETQVEVSGRRVSTTDPQVKVSGRRVSVDGTPVMVNGERVGTSSPPAKEDGKRASTNITSEKDSNMSVLSRADKPHSGEQIHHMVSCAVSSLRSHDQLTSIYQLQRLLQLGLDTSILDQHNTVRQYAGLLLGAYHRLPELEERLLLLSSIANPLVTSTLCQRLLEDAGFLIIDVCTTTTTMTTTNSNNKNKKRNSCHKENGQGESFSLNFESGKEFCSRYTQPEQEEFSYLFYYTLWASIEISKRRLHESRRDRLLTLSFGRPCVPGHVVECGRRVAAMAAEVLELGHVTRHFLTLTNCLMQAVEVH